ncbi:Gamma-aminobutyric acid receptor subunit alpha-4 [Tupaia chinensis]|uniref:Gamma-aminobutyric acid receptor subunit alpha-4 n=1 Tax=Tupaia chinensis TaxID=246437 RepID=L9L9H2_TUPCH|nr:Gamma-aminobutyric acid receptor subunit alpha-4 [Tupaia chinensis]
MDFSCRWEEFAEDGRGNVPTEEFKDAYPKSEMIYTWTKGPEKSVEVPKESSSLVQYDLIGQTVSSETIKSITDGKPFKKHKKESDED